MTYKAMKKNRRSNSISPSKLYNKMKLALTEDTNDRKDRVIEKYRNAYEELCFSVDGEYPSEKNKEEHGRFSRFLWRASRGYYNMYPERCISDFECYSGASKKDDKLNGSKKLSELTIDELYCLI